MTSQFEGFTEDTISFLRELKENNNKVWFEAHRECYQRHLVAPMKQLVEELGEFMLDEIDPFLMVTPAHKVLSRIHRDTRFSKDKSPYKSTFWLTFRRPSEGWMNDPAFFFELGPHSYRYGMGYYSASREVMDRWRSAIDGQTQEFIKTVAEIEESGFAIEGDVYKTPMGLHHGELIRPWYSRKNLYLMKNCTVNERLYGRQIVEDIRNGFGILTPVYHFMWRAKLQD
jgi:uncharacterized protein (TIGR02453 family)